MYEDLIKALRNCNYPGCGYYCAHGCIMAHGVATCELTPLLRKAADIIEELSAAIETRDKEIEWLKICVNTLPRPQKWISIKDCFPKDYENVLTCSDHGNIHIFHYSKTQKYPFNINPKLSDYYPVAYWMPLPEPPKEDS